MMTITISKSSLVVLIGASGSGKSTFARKHFKLTEIVSSDYCRGLVCDDESSQDANKDAFDLVYLIVRKRLARGKLTVIDATNVLPEARKTWIEFASEYNAPLIAIVINLPESLCWEQNIKRPNRQVDRSIIQDQRVNLENSIEVLEREGFQDVYLLDSMQVMNEVVMDRER